VTTPESYSETIEYLLNTKSTKFDIFIFDMIDSKKFGKYLTNLNEYLSETTTEKYKSGITNETYIVDNSFISIVIIY